MITYRDELVTVHAGECVAVMGALDADSIDAIVTDRPYGLGFMGKEWDALGGKTFFERKPVRATRFDHVGGNHNPTSPQDAARTARTENMRATVWHTEWAVAAFRVLKPGAHLLAFGGTRTHHRLMCRLEDAGFEIRDCLMWLYGQGFPKSLDVSKAIDMAAGAERRISGSKLGRPGYSLKPGNTFGLMNDDGWMSDPTKECAITEPATDAARQWDGWGTALKPAWEPIVLARKPLAASTVAANVLAYGTGALHVDGGRIGHTSPDDLALSKSKNPGRVDTVTSGVYGANRPQQS